MNIYDTDVNILKSYNFIMQSTTVLYAERNKAEILNY